MSLGRALLQTVPMDGGLNTNAHPMFLGTSEAQDMYNLDLSRAGNLGTTSKRKGYAKNNTTAFVTATGGGIYEYVKTNTSYLLSHYGGSNLWYNQGASKYSMTITGLSTGVADFATFTNSGEYMLFVVSPDISMQNWNGTTVQAAAGSPPANTETICVYQNRLWTADNPTYPNRVWYSALLNPSDWTTANNAGNFDVNPGDGDKIIKIYPQKDRILVLKQNGLYAIYGDRPANYFWELISQVVGCVSKKSVAGIEGVVMWRAKESVRALPEGSNSPIDVSGKIKDLVDAQTNAATCSGTIYKNLYHLTYTASGVTADTLVLDYKQGKWWKYRGLPRESLYCRDNNTAYGQNQGYVYQIDTGATDDGEPIGCYYRSGRANFQDFTKEKTFDKIGVLYEIDNATHTAQLNYSVDGISNTHTISLGHLAEKTGQVTKYEYANFQQGAVGNAIDFEIRETSTYDFSVIGVGIYANIEEDK